MTGRRYSRTGGLVLTALCLLGLWASAGVWAQAEEAQSEADLGEVKVTTSTKTERQIDEVPIAVEVITKEELEQANVKTVQEALNYVSGIQAVQDGGSWGNKGNVRLRGMDYSHTLILIDGQRFYGGHDGVDIQSISPEMVEQIEIVKGPFSSLYGSDAMGGVINIITKKGSGAPYGRLTVESGSRNTQLVESSAGFGQDKWGGVLTFTHRNSDGLEAATDKYQENVVSANLGYTFSPRSKVELNPYYSLNEMDYEERNQKRFGLNANWKYNPDELSRWYARGSMFNYKHWTEDRSTDYVDDSYEGEIGYSRLLGSRHQLTAGLQVHRELIDDNGKVYAADQTTNALFIQDEIDLAPFQVILGTRFDDHDRWGSEVNPNLSVGYQLNEKARLRGSVGKAFTAPTLVALYADNWRMGSAFIVHANPDLEPEESVGYQLGLDYRFSEQVSGQATLFRNDIENLITSRIVRSGPMPWDMYWENVGEAMTQGLELSLKRRWNDRFSGSLGYTYLETEDKDTGKELTGRPQSSLNLGLDWTAPLGLQVHFSSLYVGKRYDDDANTVKLDDYFLLNLGVERALTENYRIFIKANNLLGVDDATDAPDLDGVEYYAGLKVRI